MPSETLSLTFLTPTARTVRVHREETHHRTGRHSLWSQHLEQEEYDEERTKYFESLGYNVIPQGDNVRFWNNDVMKDMDGVIRAIVFALDKE